MLPEGNRGNIECDLGTLITFILFQGKVICRNPQRKSAGKHFELDHI
jgi:hypothetical protein